MQSTYNFCNKCVYRRKVLSREVVIASIIYGCLTAIIKLNVTFSGTKLSIFDLLLDNKLFSYVIFDGQELLEHFIKDVYYNQWFVILFPTILSFSTVLAFYISYFTNVYNVEITRSTKRKYAFEKVMVGYLHVICVCLVGEFIHGLIVCSVLSIGMELRMMELFLFLISFYLKNSLLFINSIIMGFAWLQFDLLLLLIVRDVFFALCIPIAIQYAGMKLLNFIHLWIRDTYGFFCSEEKYRILILSPFSHFSMYNDFENYFKLPVAIWFLLVIVFVFFMYFIFQKLILKRKI